MSEPHNGPVVQADPAGNTAKGVGPTNAEVRQVQHVSEEGPFYTDPEFWVAIGFLLFIGLLVYLKVQKSAAAALDARGARIKRDLDEAAQLRHEAEALLVGAERRLAAAAADAENIVAQATRNAREIVESGARELDVLVARRTKSAEDRIAAARRAAEAELRAKTVDMATEAAKARIAEHADSGIQAQLADAAIADLGRV